MDMNTHAIESLYKIEMMSMLADIFDQLDVVRARKVWRHEVKRGYTERGLS